MHKKPPQDYNGDPVAFKVAADTVVFGFFLVQSKTALLTDTPSSQKHYVVAPALVIMHGTLALELP